MSRNPEPDPEDEMEVGAPGSAEQAPALHTREGIRSVRIKAPTRGNRKLEKFLAAVTEEAVKARYDQEMADFVPAEEIHARHILVNTDQEDLAKEIIAELDAGGDFAAIAAEKSQDPGSGASGSSSGRDWLTSSWLG